MNYGNLKVKPKPIQDPDSTKTASFFGVTSTPVMSVSSSGSVASGCVRAGEDILCRLLDESIPVWETIGINAQVAFTSSVHVIMSLCLPLCEESNLQPDRNLQETECR